MRSRRFQTWHVLALVVALVVALLSLGPATPVDAAEASSPQTTVRVGYFDNGDFMHKAADGSYEGYDVEYFYTLAGYANWKIQFVDYPNLSAALEGLKAGDVDMMSGLSKTAEREASYLVSARKMCTTHIAVQTRAGDDRFSPGDTSDMTNMTCGILKGSNVVALYQAWCAENALTPRVVEYDTLQERNEALASGQVDAIAAGSTIEGAQKVAEFPGLDIFFMLNKSRGDLKAQVDRSMSILSLSEPSYETNLFLKYFPASKNTSPSFSATEKAFVASHQTIRVAVLIDDAPFSVVDPSGHATGVLPEYFDHLGQQIGITFECVGYANKDAACAALASGEVDAIGKYQNDAYDANARGTILGDTYLSMNLVQITRAGTGTVSTVTVPECNADMVEGLASDADFPASIITCSNAEECFGRLRAGEVDAVICPQVSASWLLTRNRSSDYVVSSFGTKSWDACMAFALGTDGNLLRSVVNKTIAVDGNYIDQLITRDTLQDSADLTGILERIPTPLLATLAIGMFLVAALAVVSAIVLARRRTHERRLAEQQAEADRRESELRIETRANEAQQRFFGTVSHDMRTPLNGIMGFSDLALESDDPACVHDYLEKIRTSGRILTDLVDDTLVMSRVSSGKLVLHPTPCDNRELFDDVCLPIRAMAEAKGVEFSDNVADLPPRAIMVDRPALQKVLLNLLSNAVKFTQAGGTVTLGVSLVPAGSDDPDSVLTVSDTGEGISAEFLPHVFDAFSQESPMLAGSTTGTGLGLSIAKGVVEAMGGTIAVASEKGKGSTFTVRLHLEKAEQPLPPDAAGPDALAGRTVLVCEDNALNAEIIRTILEKAGADVVVAENGEEGVEAFRASAPGDIDAVLLDLRMPVMDGFAAARAIRALDRAGAAGVPIFAVSADAYPEDVQRCLEAGMNGHLAKPVSVDDILAALKEGGVGR
ncbi:MAG: transporter substrate-binding domain-containing protein [Atopobiaceae bacterium]|jgi:signal transduction histidine kinase/ActR/RegA family two-component response regulator|nr:transporter substrate-binding domain-containing protein [Atopobiaceae bacterium]